MLTSGLLVGLAVGVVTVLVARPLLHWLPEPVAPDQPRYRDLGTGSGFLLTCGVASAAGGLTAWVTLPLLLQPIWWVLSSVGVLLAVIDARTTWLPLRLTRLCWALAALACGSAAIWGDGWRTVLHAGAGATIAGALYLTVWLVSRGGIGFGDVRFAPVLGAATAAHSWSMLAVALLAGTVIGALHGLVQLTRRRRGGFPYAPSMLAGAYLACWWA